jgi:hypothetical protein
VTRFLALIGFALSTGFALTVDVGLYSIVHFATTNGARTALRFAIEIATAHAVFLVVGALSAEFIAHSLGSDVLVDAVSAIALLVVLRGAFGRAMEGPHAEAGDEAPTAHPNAGVVWFTAFALSLDALLVSPSVDEFVGDVSTIARLYALALLFLGVFVFSFVYAAFSKRLRALVLDPTAESRRRRNFLSIASAAELGVFSMFFAEGVFGVFEHLVTKEPVAPVIRRVSGFAFGLVLFSIARFRARRMDALRELSAGSAVDDTPR